jgi:hypothetical protein
VDFRAVGKERAAWKARGRREDGSCPAQRVCWADGSTARLAIYVGGIPGLRVFAAGSLVGGVSGHGLRAEGTKPKDGGDARYHAGGGG